uniref:Chemokine interleukin-8-like domain-containing protein n=1 Tax=Sinocyclocheilus grahami TaxID=75366 RepID=A0A672LP17_SINGR
EKPDVCAVPGDLLFGQCWFYTHSLLKLFLISPTVDGPAVPERCCFNLVDFQIPAKRIVSAVETDSRCPIPAIV